MMVMCVVVLCGDRVAITTHVTSYHHYHYYYFCEKAEKIGRKPMGEKNSLVWKGSRTFLILS